MENKRELELLDARKGFAEVEIIYGVTNKPYNFKPSNKTPKVSIFIGDLVGLTLTEDGEVEKYVMSYNDGAYVFEEVISIGVEVSLEDLKKQCIVAYNELCKRSEQVIDKRYVKKSLFSLTYL